MEYFKVRQKTTGTTIEINKSEDGYFIIELVSFKERHKKEQSFICLSSTEARDLMEFISKRLSEVKPHEVESPF